MESKKKSLTMFNVERQNPDKETIQNFVYLLEDMLYGKLILLINVKLEKDLKDVGFEESFLSRHYFEWKKNLRSPNLCIRS